jgi:hypothetical protein
VLARSERRVVTPFAAAAVVPGAATASAADQGEVSTRWLQRASGARMSRLLLTRHVRRF